MRKALLAGAAAAIMLLSACGGTTQPEFSQEDTKENVQNFYNEISALDESSKSSLDDFNKALSAYSAGTLAADDLEKAIEKFQDTSSDLADKAKKVKVSSRFPDEIEKMLIEAKDSFEKAYNIKKEASESADSPSVTAEQFDQMNKNADIVMLYGISKLNQAREATGLLSDQKAN